MNGTDAARVKGLAMIILAANCNGNGARIVEQWNEPGVIAGHGNGNEMLGWINDNQR